MSGLALYAVFGILSAIALGGSIGVVTARNVIHAAMALLAALMAAAGLFVMLYAPFLAMVQVLIYGGAVTIVILFAIMLTRSSEFPAIMDNAQKPLAFISATLAFLLIGFAFVAGRRGPGATAGPALTDLAKNLFQQWAIPFEIASLVLLVALLGAVIIARTEEAPEGLSAAESVEDTDVVPAAPAPSTSGHDPAHTGH